MSYCDFNPRLFKEFTSMKKKIQPAMSDDWEIVPDGYNTNSGFSMKSKKLNQQVADIELRRFLRFSKEQNLTIIGLNLQGNFIIGNDRSVYTEEMYNKWREKFEERTETIIESANYQVGNQYKTPCGMTLIYLGEYYVSSLKNKEYRNKDYSVHTKPAKKHLVISPDAIKSDGTSKSYYSYSAGTLTQKFAKDLGQYISEENVQLYLNNWLNSDPTLVYLSKEKPAKDAELKLVSITPKTEQEYKKALIFRSSDKFYTSYYGGGIGSQLFSNGGTSYKYYMNAFDPFTLKCTAYDVNRRGWSDDLTTYRVDEIYCISLC